MSMMNKTAYVGIDASKGYADFIVLQSDKGIAEPAFRLYDVAEGHRRLGSLIEQWLQKGYDHICCGVESTGGYENNWVNYLQLSGEKKPVYIVRLNPKAVKSLSEAALTRTITDSVSASSIALYLIDFKSRIHYLQSSQSQRTYKEARKHNSFIRMLKKQRNQLGNQLEKLIYEHLSPLMCYCRNSQPLWLLALLEKYATAEGIKKAGVSRLIKIKGISKDKATSLVEKMTGLNTQASDHISVIIKRTAAQILHLEQSIKKEKEDLYHRFKHCDEVLLLTTATGIGYQSAVEILVEIEDVNRFESAKKLVAYFGTHPMWKQSGDGIWGNHMSKKGRSEIRAVLYMCCLTAIRHDELFKALYATTRAKGKNHYSSMGVIMNKMLRIIYGILKNKTKYNSQTDYNNRQNARAKQKNKEEKQIQNNDQKQTKLERFNLEEVKDLPVSKRYAKKKRQSPKLQFEECTGSDAS